MFVILGEMVFACRGILIFSTCDMTAKALRSMAMEYNFGVEWLNLRISALSTSLYIGPVCWFKPCFLICKIKWLNKIMLKFFFFYLKNVFRTLLVVQCPVGKSLHANAGDASQSLVREDPICCQATKPVHHNDQALLVPMLCNNR